MKPTQLAKDGQRDTMHYSQYVTQCNTVHNKTQEIDGGLFFWKSIPKNRCMVCQYFESRRNCAAFESDSGRGTSISVCLNLQKIVQKGGFAKLKCYVRE